MNRERETDVDGTNGSLLALTFDFWGTLYQNAYAQEERIDALERILKRYDQPRSKERVEAAYNHAGSVWDRTWREEQRSIPTARWLHEVLRYLDASIPSEVAGRLGQEIEESFLQSEDPRPVAGVIDVVPALAETYRLGVISDTGLTPGRVLRGVMERDGLLHAFDVLTFSDEFGKAKPRPEPFMRTLELLGARPGQAAHIGDLPETDLRGARSVGMKAVLFLGVSGREDGREMADAVFSDYHELQQLLKRRL